MKISDLFMLLEKNPPTPQWLKDKVKDLIIDPSSGKRRSNREIAKMVLGSDDPSSEMKISNIVKKLKIAPNRYIWTKEIRKEVEKLLYQPDGSRTPVRDIADKILGDTSDSAIQSINNMLYQYFPDRDHVVVVFSDQEKEQVENNYFDLEGNVRSNPQIAQLVYGKKEDFDTNQEYYIGRIKGIIRHFRQQNKLPLRPSAEPISKLDIEKAAEWFKNGETVSGIARKLNRPHTTLIRHLESLPNYEDLKDANKNNSSHYVTPSQLAYMIEEFKKGAPPYAIALRLDKAASTVTKNLKNLKQSKYYTDLIPEHLANRKQPPGASISEQVFFEILQSFVDMPQIVRNKNMQLKPGQRRPYNCDGVYGNIVIEFYGDLWHANPKLYPDDEQVLNKVGLPAGDIRTKDKIKEEFLLSIGYKVLIVWEKEWALKTTRINVINRIRREFKLAPITQEDLNNLLLSYNQVNNPQSTTKT
jgi:hypothetical protein